MNTMKDVRYRIELFVKGAIAVLYFGHLIALIDAQGHIQWRDEKYPVYLINYLMTIPTPEMAEMN